MKNIIVIGGGASGMMAAIAASANGANEESVKLFLNGKIKFTDIAYLNNEAMKNAPEKENFTLEDVLEADRKAREYVIEAVG